MTAEARTQGNGRTGVGDGAEGEADAVFTAERSRLTGLAYRMIGQWADAEDVVQDAWVRWRSADRGQVRNPAAFLTTVTTRLALDRLRALSRARETYVGPWLPEPVPTGADPDPAEAVVLAESLTLGFLTVLDRLEPAERAAFLLREVFGEPYEVLAEALGRSEPACRQLVHRARARVAAERSTRRARRPPDPASRQALLDAFAHAVATGDVDGLMARLCDDVLLVSDGGPHHRAARNPVRGPWRVARLLVGLGRRTPPGAEITPMSANHEPAALLHRRGAPILLIVFELDGDRIAGLRIVVNPDKLGTVMAAVAATTT